MIMDISAFIIKLKTLKVDRSKGLPAPHKALLLLSVIQLMNDGKITENRIFITPELVAKFKDNFHTLVTEGPFQPNFSLPFYHLKNDGFWHLAMFPEAEILLTSSSSIKSFLNLKNTVDYAFFDENVYQLFKKQQSRDIIELELIDTYFKGKKSSYANSEYHLFDDIELQILNESPVEYKREVVTSDEEERFVRNGVFKRVVPKIYNYTCCISGMRIIATREVQMIDACHIVPFSESYNDTIGNGISLSPTFHRAFDRFLITIDEEYNIIVSEHFVEKGNYSIRQLHGKKIILPQELKFYPSLENLKWHKEKFLFMNRC